MKIDRNTVYQKPYYATKRFLKYYFEKFTCKKTNNIIQEINLDIQESNNNGAKDV